MRNQLKVGALLTYLGLLVGNVVSLLYTPFMLKTMGQSQYGLFTLANAVIGYLTVLDFGFGSATVRYTAKYNAENNHHKVASLYGMFITLYLIIGFIILVIGVCLSFSAHKIFSTGLSGDEIHTIRILLVLASVNLAVSFPFGVFTSIITAYEQFVFLKISSLVRLILNPVVYVPTLLLGYKAVGLVIASSILNVTFLLINTWYCFSRLKIRIDFKCFDANLLKEVSAYSFWIFIGSIVNQLWWNSGQFLLGIFSSSASIAVYGVSMQFKSYFETFATAVSGVFLPRMTRMSSNMAQDEEFSQSFIKVGRLQFIIISLITTGFILFGKQFLAIWAGVGYEPAYYTTLIIFIPLALVDTQTLGITILQAKNKHRFRAILYLFVAILCILLCIPLIKKYGVYGCAFATGLALTVGNLVVMNWYYHKKIKLNIFRFWKEILRMSFGVIIAFFLGVIILRNIPELKNYSSLLPAIICYCFVFFVFMYFLSFNNYERSLVVGLLKRVRGKRYE